MQGMATQPVCAAGERFGCGLLLKYNFQRGVFDERDLRLQRFAGMGVGKRYAVAGFVSCKYRRIAERFAAYSKQGVAFVEAGSVECTTPAGITGKNCSAASELQALAQGGLPRVCPAEYEAKLRQQPCKIRLGVTLNIAAKKSLAKAASWV